MSGQDTTSQDPFSTTRCSKKKEETNKRKNNQNTWISHKRARLHGACKLHYEKKILQEETSPSTLVHPILSHLKFPSQKLSLSWRPPWTPEEPDDRCPGASCSFSLSALASFSSIGFVRLRTMRKNEPHSLFFVYRAFYNLNHDLDHD